MKLKVVWRNANNHPSKDFIENLFRRNLLEQVDFDEDCLYRIHQDAIQSRRPDAAMLKIYALAHLNTFWHMQDLLPSEKNDARMALEWGLK